MNAFFKVKQFVSKAWRRSAKGKSCTLRLPGVCNGNPETVVLAHYRLFGWGGMAQKPHDFLACYACKDCHDEQERNFADGVCGYDDLLRAMGETLTIHYEEGRIG